MPNRIWSIFNQWLLKLNFHFVNIYVNNNNMNWTIEYYSINMQDDIRALPAKLKAQYFKLTKRMLAYGPNLMPPHTKAFGNGLFELRLKGQEGIARVFYCTVIDQKIVMLHAFIKKSQKTPTNDIDIAKRRLKEVKDKYDKK